MVNQITNSSINTRYTAPSKYDIAPKGTVCKVVCDNNITTRYIQVADTVVPTRGVGDGQTVNWIKMGDFLESSMRRLLKDKSFIEACMYLFDGYTTRGYPPIKGTKEEKDLITGLAVAIERCTE